MTAHTVDAQIEVEMQDRVLVTGGTGFTGSYWSGFPATSAIRLEEKESWGCRSRASSFSSTDWIAHGRDSAATGRVGHVGVSCSQQ